MNGQYNTQKEHFNMVNNWHLHVFEVRSTQKGAMLSASLSGRKKDDGTYAKSMSVSVFMGNNTRCEFAPGTDLSNTDIAVDGTFSKGDYIGKDNVERPQFTIFANRISIRQRPQRQNYQQGGYQNQPQGGYNQGGYQNQPQGGYQNAPQGGYNQQPQQNYNQQPQGGYQNAPQGGYQNQPQQPMPQQNYNQAPQGGYNQQPQGNYNQQGGQPQQNGNQGYDYSEFSQFAGGVDDSGVPF